jgi:hypothetical protein
MERKGIFETIYRVGLMELMELSLRSRWLARCQ